MTTRFRFSPSETPPEQLFLDIQNVNSFSEQQAAEFVTSLLSFLAQEDGSSDLMETISVFAQQHDLSAAALRNTVRGFLFFFKGAIRFNLTPLYVKEDLISFGVAEEKAAAISTLWKKKFVLLSRSVIGQTLMVSQVVDMEWKFGVTAASDELSKVASSFLQLKLVLDKGGNTREDVYMELTLPQFYEFFNELQKAKASLDFFS